MNLLRIALLLAFCLLISEIVVSQEMKSIQIVDRLTNEPIIGASFSYDNQEGFSDDNGNIQIELNEKGVLKLSHLNYGQWMLTNSEVVKAFSDGKIFRESNTINLQPVSVIAYNTGDQTKRIDLNDHHKLNHDAGAVLNTDVSINSIKKSGAYGFDPVLRGFKYDQLNVVINGSCSALAACPNRMDPVTSQIPLNAIESIQILKGPYSLRYGTSFGGTINFLTPKTTFSDRLKTSGRLSTAYETNGNIYRSDGLFKLQSKKIDLRIVGSWSQGDDYKDGNQKPVQSDFSRSSFGSDLAVKLTENQLVKLAVNRNFGRNTDFPSLPMDLISDDTWLFNAEHSLIVKNRKLSSWKTLAYATHVDHLMDNSLKILNPRTMNAISPTQTLTFGGRTETSWNFGNSTTYAGLDLRIENAEGSRTREILTGPNAGKIFTDNIWQDSRIARSGLFAETNIVTANLLYVIAGRFEINTADATDAAPEFLAVNPNTSSQQVNPSFSLGIIKNFNHFYSLKLWAGSSQRSAGLTERYINYFAVGRDAYELLGNPSLKPERNNQTDLIFEIKSEKTFFNINLFASLIQNYITSVKNAGLKPRIATSPGVRQFLNLDHAFKTGFEMNWKQYLFYGIQQQAAIAYTYAEDLKNKLALPKIAPFEIRYALVGSHLSDQLITEISLRHVLKQNRISIEYGEKETPSFTTLDFNLTYKLPKYLSIATGVQNIFNVAYYEHLNRSISGSATEYLFNRGRNFYLTLVFDFK
jgi:iron complex outermembrane receptor protein